MIVLDLKPVIFIILMLFAGCTLIAIFANRRRRNVSLISHLGGNEAQLHRAFEDAPFGLAVVSKQLECLYANTIARSLLNMPSSQGSLPNLGWSAELWQDVADMTRADDTSSHYRTMPLSAEQTISWWIYPLSEMILIGLIDLSPQYRAEKAARISLGNISHELRTPLTAILTHLEIMGTPNIPQATWQKSLDFTRQETRRMARLVQDLLDLGRLEVANTLEFQPLDLILTAEEAIAHLILDAEAREITISLQSVSPLPRVWGDQDRLKQVFLNILDNAVKYGRPGDSIEVILSLGTGGVVCRICDTGPGIPAEHLPHVGERFYRGFKDIPGSGLGLALVSEILRHHHSHIEIDSQTVGEHTGTVMQFTLPLAQSH